MVNQQLVQYLQKNKETYGIEPLKKTLKDQGYSSQEVEAAAKVAIGPQVPGPNGKVAKNGTKPTASKSNVSGRPSEDFGKIDPATKETMIASAVGLIFAQLLIFAGDFILGRVGIFSAITSLIYAAIIGAITGFLIAKLYYKFMDFVSESMRFLLPLTDTFFKLLFVPVLIGSIIALFFSLLVGGLVFLAGATLGGVGGGLLGGVLGGSLIVIAVISIVINIVARFIYAKYMVHKVGKYYKDYKVKK